MRFDAYAASVRYEDVARVSDVLAQSVNGYVMPFRPLRRCVSTQSIEVDGRMAAWVGLDAASGQIYIEAKGETTPGVAAAIREHFPEHNVPRADVCEDYNETGAFDKLIDLVRAYKGPRTKSMYVALPDDPREGKTWAAGTRGGVAYVRVYEAGKHPDRQYLGRPDWARLEGEFRPQYSKDKRAAATLSPMEFWGLSKWSHGVGEAITQCTIPRMLAEARKYSHDKTTRYIALTFRRHLEEMIANGEDIARTLQAIWQEEDALSQARP
jgi:hypothetical protein